VTEQLLVLPPRDRRDVYEAVADYLGLPATIIEKDVWICWSLQTIFTNNLALPMAFKGGTSLSKVYGAINRFSEDIDLTLDFGELDQQLPTSRNQRDKLSAQLRKSVAKHVVDAVVPHLCTVASQSGQQVSFKCDGAELVTIKYPSCFQSSDGYVSSLVKIEFGGRNRIVPSERHIVTTYIESAGIDLATPRASVNVLSPIRTFWEKVTLAHAECARQEWRHNGERFARHWSDLAALADHQIAVRAIADRAVLEDVVRIKTAFWPQTFTDYKRCLVGDCRIVPAGALLVGLSRDYAAMVSAGMFAIAPPPFEVLVDHLRKLEVRINEAMAR